MNRTNKLVNMTDAELDSYIDAHPAGLDRVAADLEKVRRERMDEEPERFDGMS